MFPKFIKFLISSIEIKRYECDVSDMFISVLNKCDIIEPNYRKKKFYMKACDCKFFPTRSPMPILRFSSLEMDTISI